MPTAILHFTDRHPGPHEPREIGPEPPGLSDRAGPRLFETSRRKIHK